jgi:hypothetical protein
MFNFAADHLIEIGVFLVIFYSWVIYNLFKPDGYKRNQDHRNVQSEQNKQHRPTTISTSTIAVTGTVAASSSLFDDEISDYSGSDYDDFVATSLSNDDDDTSSCDDDF